MNNDNRAAENEKLNSNVTKNKKKNTEPFRLVLSTLSACVLPYPIKGFLCMLILIYIFTYIYSNLLQHNAHQTNAFMCSAQCAHTNCAYQAQKKERHKFPKCKNFEEDSSPSELLPMRLFICTLMNASKNGFENVLTIHILWFILNGKIPWHSWQHYFGFFSAFFSFFHRYNDKVKDLYSAHFQS